MITDGEKWHYIALKSLPKFVAKKWCYLALKSLPEFDGKEWNYHALKRLPEFDSKEWQYLPSKSVAASLRGITSNHSRDFYCLNCFHSYSTKNTLKNHKSVCNDHDHCRVEMPNEDNKTLEYNHGEKSLKISAIIYADLECLL